MLGTGLGTIASRITRARLGLLVTAAVLLCLAGIAVLALDVRRSIQAQASASSDNTQWTLVQVDVEFLYLKDSVNAAMAQTGSLGDLRKRFDILYSRTTTLTDGSVFSALATDADYASGLESLRRFLLASTALIDGPDANLRAALPRFEQQILQLRPEVKKIALAGIKVFAQISDDERESIVRTLVAVAVLTSVMIVLLLSLVAVLMRLDRINRASTRDLSLSLARTEAIVDTAIDPVIAVDAKCRVIAFNPAAEKVFGIPRAEALGADMADMILPASQRAADVEALQALLGAEAKGRLRLTAKRRSGAEFPAELSVARSADRSGTILVAFLRDLSVEVAAEQALLQARDDALAREKAKADLLAVMSHEMRTPLNGLLGMIEVLEDTGLTPRQQEFLTVMRNSGHLLLHHVNDVLNIARLESGKMPFQASAVDLQALVAEIFANQSTASAAHGNRLEYRALSGPNRVITDPVHLGQILINLIGNAIKFTRNGRVVVETEQIGPLREFRVIDNGIGIAEADLERIFEDFVTLDATYARTAGGTGLGLGITRRLVQNMGGTIQAESQPGQGSLFRLRLPMAAAGTEAAPQTTAAPPAPQNPAPLSVLVVEDNPVNRLVVREMLTRLGHSVTEAHDGDEGLRLAQSQHFNLILMDISMPRMDGVTATRAIRAARGGAALPPIIALTAHALPEEIARFKQAGMQDVLVKPISTAALVAMLARAAVPEPDLATADLATADLLDDATLGELIETIGPERSQQLMRGFLHEADAVLMRLADQPDPQPEPLRAEIHKLCGSAAMFGAKALNHKLRQMETLAKQGNVAQVLAELPTAQVIWQDSKAGLSARMAALP